MKRRFVALTVCAMLAAAPALALFGFGDIVMDPWSIAQEIAILEQSVQEVMQTIAVVNMTTATYNQILSNARLLANAGRYGSQWARWQTATAANRYGLNRGWLYNANGLTGSYAGSVRALPDIARIMGRLGPSTQTKWQYNYSSGELLQGVSQESLDTVGEVRTRSSATDGMLEQLSGTMLSNNEHDQTEVAVLQEGNVATLAGARGVQDSNKLLAVMAEHQSLQAKMMQDAMADQLNQEMELRTTGQAVTQANIAGTDNALRTWNWGR